MNISPSFRPNISPRSLKIIKKSTRKNRYKSKTDQSKLKEEEELEKCTFKPQLNQRTKNISQKSKFKKFPKSPVFQRLAEPKIIEQDK